MKRFYSNGKLFITGEYVVLDGAKAFALPTKAGQDLIVGAGSNKEITWKSFDADGSLWFHDTITFTEIIDNKKSESEVRNTLVGILHEANTMNPQKLQNSEGFSVTTHLTFPRKWGLGTSSTLINNLADWFGVDAFELLRRSFGGSGYDIACAKNDLAIVYTNKNNNPQTHTFDFSPDFSDKLYFVYLNQKQNSKSAIASYREKAFDAENLVKKIDMLTDLALTTSDLNEFKNALEQHEILLGEVLKTIPVKKSLFSDFDGTIKSLGAWGGDFVLAVSETDPSEYFKSKGYETVIPYREMIL